MIFNPDGVAEAVILWDVRRGLRDLWISVAPFQGLGCFFDTYPGVPLRFTPGFSSGAPPVLTAGFNSDTRAGAPIRDSDSGLRPAKK